VTVVVKEAGVGAVPEEEANGHRLPVGVRVRVKG